MIYGIICFTQYLNVKRKGRPLENIEDQVKSPMKIFDVWAFLFCLFVAIMTIAAYLGLKLMPVPDFVVFGHTSPVYTVLFSACILRYVLLDILFPSNHNIHKSLCGHCFWASDPLIERY